MRELRTMTCGQLGSVSCYCTILQPMQYSQRHMEFYCLTHLACVYSSDLGLLGSSTLNEHVSIQQRSNQYVNGRHFRTATGFIASCPSCLRFGRRPSCCSRKGSASLQVPLVTSLRIPSYNGEVEVKFKRY